ncbi:Non-repetitive/WGA-negative nucleoporin C-terminal-domain-containing protein [Phakopsora pachyrhizi]|uniref:Non-repetitive/WGA-negative nucleoporin C-terminal-domain-containing protein n=1 Tax=Phakopsora pachyrhizi TaxID=170000 RepID=A0AAV0BEL7_PHAPC|nr:Non-repetitive/WGA-negative nucleoporin C-terminal-domain-containing protein [Phakopsora pachyrhizi]CAH7685697.1 Non-repetitive/WGA-negative nucleoporin C-terminal-domain-containing protein [Phakopsora pachyrhizi]
MFSNQPSRVLPHARRRTGLRSQSKVQSVGLNDHHEILNNYGETPQYSDSQVAPPRINNMLGMVESNSAQRIGSFTQSNQKNLVKPLTVAEEQTMALEEGLKQAGLTGSGPSILLQDDFHAVTSHSQLPADVLQMLTDSDINYEAFRSHIDHSTGFAYAWSKEICYVWNSSRRSSNLPTCYSFPCPSSKTSSVIVQTLAPLPFAALIVYSSSNSSRTKREPGILLVSPTGELRAWDSLSLALSGVDKYATVQIQLRDAELVRCLQPLSWCPGSFVIATSHSRLFGLSVVTGTGGKPTVVSSIIARSHTWSTKLGSLIRWGESYDPKAGIVALAASPTLDGDPTVCGGEILALETTGVLHKWKMDMSGGGERFIWEKETTSIILESLVPTPEADVLTMAERIELTFLDIKVTYTRDLAILLKYVDPTASGDPSSSIKPRSFAIIVFDLLSNSSLLTVSHCIKARHREFPDPRLETEPSLILPHGGPAALITFPERVIALSLMPGTDYEEVISLKDNAFNRIIGIGAAPLSIRSLQDNSDYLPTAKLLTTSSGILELELNPVELAKPLPKDSDAKAARETSKLQAKLEQAVFFGDHPENPIAFSLEGPLKGDLPAAAEKLSEEIMISSASHLPNIVDLRAQLADRLARLHLLIRFISSAGMLGVLPKTSRRNLMTDSELLAATHALWLHQNRKIHALSHARRPIHTFLGDAISNYMDSIGLGDSDDVVRSFFRSQAPNIVSLLECIQNKLKSSLDCPSHSIHYRSVLILESNEVLLTTYNSAIGLRNAHSKTYDLQNDTSTEPWSSSIGLLNLLQYHYDSTLEILQQRAREFGPTIDEDQARFGAEPITMFLTEDWENLEGTSDKNKDLQQVLKDQLTELAERSLQMMNERIAFLSNVRGESNQETKAMNERYLRLRPQLVLGLVKTKRTARAISLAEEQRDFRTLVQLCYTSGISGGDRKVKNYIDRFQGEFAFQLYQWYVEQGRYLDLLTQDPVYAPLLVSFLDSTDYGKFSWIHDLAIDRFEHAANVLVNEGVNERELADQKLMLSLGKLCQVAQIHVEDLKSEQTLRAIEAVDDRLDIVDAQLRLAGLCSSILQTQPQYSLQTIDGQAVTLVKHLATNLDNRPAFRQLFERFIRQVLAGECLQIEDLIDMYSLKANLDDQMEDFVIALNTFSRAKDWVPGRAQLALQSVWRRIYIHEDWVTLKKTTNLSDEDLMNCLKSTALYCVLSRVIGSQGLEKCELQVLKPKESFFDPTVNLDDDLSIRYPDHSLAELEQLMKDYQFENSRLEESIENGGLMDYYGEIFRLIQQEVKKSNEGADSYNDLEEKNGIREVSMMSE